MAWEDKTNDASLEMAFTAANAKGSKIFFSFDYAGNGPWDQEVLTSMIPKYGSSFAYFLCNGKPFVSTFKGPGNADDWVTLKAKTNCSFVPDWSSVGANPAVELTNGVADGLFSWLPLVGTGRARARFQSLSPAFSLSRWSDIEKGATVSTTADVSADLSF
ncbi:hypothetical protein N7508_009797 [Penicillium antarcticum]|nr:uncharacterized protein N7508_009797 [Penicillium antarcticum]KAJ5294976.1 hypothetical protein N7508_009797 [Penicillium antarcticum]